MDPIDLHRSSKRSIISGASQGVDSDSGRRRRGCGCRVSPCGVDEASISTVVVKAGVNVAGTLGRNVGVVLASKPVVHVAVVAAIVDVERE